MKTKTSLLLALGALSAAAAAANAFHSIATPAPTPSTRDGIQRFYVNTPSIPLDATAYIATEVVHGRIEGMREVIPDRGIAHTVYTVRVLQALKGTTKSTIDVSVAGVVNADFVVDVVGAPRFVQNEEVVLFLWTSPVDGETGVLGLQRGVYRVEVAADQSRHVTGDHALHEELNQFFARTGAAWVRLQERLEAQEGK
ncbi:MAG: hypothetical protein L6Q99_01945 [Planctomycetes bacterium]|nr:hypothetical protein [Planctomycetota bacterium]